MGMRDFLRASQGRFWKVALVAALTTWTACETRAQTWAQDQFTVGQFTVNFLAAGASYYPDDPTAVTSQAVTIPEKQAVMRAYQYWAERLGMNTTITDGAGGSVVANVGYFDPGDPYTIAAAGSIKVVGDVGGTKGNGFVLAQPQAILTGMATPATTATKWAGADGFILFSDQFTNFSTLRNTQVDVSSPSGFISVEATMIHELGHSLGITRTSTLADPADPTSAVQFGDPLSLFESEMRVNGNAITAGSAYAQSAILGSGNSVTYVGANTRAVYGDAWIPPAQGFLPVENNVLPGEYASGSDLVHPHTLFGLMNAVNMGTERPFFSEAELALIQDLGHTIQLRDFFGRSIFQNNHIGAITNTQGFGLWVPAQNRYDTTQANTSTFGIGLHIVGAGNTVIQDADMNTAGYAGTGIRIENDGNRVTLAQGRTITATGDQGSGVLLWNDRGTIFTQRGTIAVAPANIGMWFDNSTASEVNVTGTINGGDFASAGAAIYMGTGSRVIGGISFMRESGATLAINGDIMGDSALSTTLRFGAAAAADGRLARDAYGTIIGDSAYNFTYAGIILGTCFDLDFVAGQTTLSGTTIAGRALVRQGAVWNATGSFQGSNVINSGTVNAVGSIVTLGQFVNEESGMLWASGALSARGGLANNGTIALANSIGTVAFGGTFTNNATGRLNLSIQPPAGPGAPVAGVNNDQIRIQEFDMGTGDGKAVFNGGSIHTTVAGPAVQIGQVYSILTTESGLTVNAEPIVYDNIPLLGLFPHYDGMNMWLDVQRNLYGPYGHTYNQRQFGTYFDTLTENPVPGTDLYDLIVLLDSIKGGASNYINDAALHVLDQMSGSVYGSIMTRGVQNTSVVNQTLAGVLRRNEFLPVGGEMAAMPYAPKPRWNVWGVGYDFGGATLADGNAFGYNENLGGTLVGMDCEATEDLRLGGYFTYGEGRMSVKGLAEQSESKELGYGGYLRHRAGIGYLLAFGGFGYNDYSNNRYLDFASRTASSQYGANKSTFYGEYGIDFTDKSSTFQPFFGMQYAGLQHKSFTETGAGIYDLAVDESSADSLRMMVGSRFGLNLFATQRGKVALTAQALWMYDMLNRPYMPVTAQFAEMGAGGNFTVHGNTTGRDWAVFGGGLNWDLGSIRLSAGYDLYMNNCQSLHAGNAAMVFRW